MAFVDIVINH